MGELDPRLSKAVTTHALVLTGLNIAHSLRVRGLRRTLLFAVLGTTIPLLSELLAVNVLKVLRHHGRPQVGGVPLAIALGWYNVAYGTFAVMESILSATGAHGEKRNGALAPAAALAATNLDLLLDPFGLDLGLWEWSGDGPYAAEVEGPNSKRGVPLLNYAGWIALTTSITLSYQRLALDAGPSHPRASSSGHGAALLLLSYYLPALAWAVKRRRWKCLLYSAPFAAMLWAALKGMVAR